MAVVLFIITIPTEAEELRLRNEFYAKKFDLHSDHVDGKFTSLPVTMTTSTTTSCTTSTTAHVAGLNLPEYVAGDNQFTDSGRETNNADDVDAISGETAGTPVTHLYSTFPQRRKSEKNAKSALDGVTTLQKSQGIKDDGGGSASDSLKDIDVDNTDTPALMRKSWEGLRDILSTTKKRTSKKKDFLDLDLPNDTCMEIVLRGILRKFKVFNAVWTKDTEGRMYQIVFTVEFNENYENILEKLHEWGIGDREGSTVSVMNCVVSKTFTCRDSSDMHAQCSRANINAQKQGAWNRFMNSVRSRLNVAQIIRDVRQDAAITFDFVILLVSAAILASFGLIEDSTIFLASSMLISPLMGPIIAGIFGTAIKDRGLRSLGLKNELFGILLATFVGLIFGIVACFIDERYGTGEGLTREILSRCELHSLLVGVLTAIPSGAAAAIGILGGNIGSLVGVAISASLLPPAVNSGLLWALALVYKYFEADESRYKSIIKTHSYSDNQAYELAILGSISMGLTISNVICVYLMGVLVLKVKEVAPIISGNNREFWQHDIKIARDLNKNGITTDTTIIDELAALPKEDQKVLGINCELLRNIQLDEEGYQNTWSPIGNHHLFDPASLEAMRNTYSTVHRIERLYSTINQQQSLKYKRFTSARHTTGNSNDFGTTYKILSESLPRCATMPTQGICPSIHITTPGEASCSTANISASSRSSGTNTPTGAADERKGRKFIVTPAEDPLHIGHDFDDIDV